MSHEISDETIMPFGKYKGEFIANVPAKTLLYYYDNYNLHGDVKLYIDQNKEMLELEALEND